MSDTYIKSLSSLDELGSLHGNNWQLQHHGQEAVPAKLLGNTDHHQFVADRAHKKRNEHRA